MTDVDINAEPDRLLAGAPLAGPRPAAGGADELAAIAERAGLHRVHILSWRDLADPEAGGSEVHAAEIARRWATAGIDVVMRSSHADGAPSVDRRDGYRVIRKAGRYSVFPRTAASGLVGRTGQRDAMVEIWNGMPFFSPVWAHCPRVVFLHHVHDEMWRMVLRPRALGTLGRFVELKVAPPLYRRARIVTLSDSSRDEIVHLLGLPAANIDVVPPGIDARFSPGPPTARSPHPLVVAVGRLVPVKRLDRLVDALVEVRRHHPDLEAVLVGEGYERPALEARVRAARAGSWLHLPGRLGDDELVELYRRAWAVASASAREGWGMTVTEAAACATPAVVTRIAGHIDAVADGRSGLLVDAHDPAAGLAAGLRRVLGDASLRARLERGALEHADAFGWDRTARRTLEVLATEAARRNARLRRG